MRILRSDSPGWLADAAAVLRRGGLVAFPTDTVYGIGAQAFDPVAVGRIHRAKGRPDDQPIAVLVSGWHDLDRLTRDIPAGAQRLADAFWPGPLTLVVPKGAGLPAEVSPGRTVGVRAPDHPVAQDILRAAGPLAVSSANRSGEPSTVSAEEVQAAIGGHLDLLIDGGAAPGGRASTVLDCTVDPPQVLRPGPIHLGDILRVWKRD